MSAAESFTEEEKALLSRYFTNVEGPVFALINLPEVVKGALFARYSRSPKSLKRLFLDEFVEDVREGEDGKPSALLAVKRAEELYDRVLSEYGDDSVAQLGGAHVACENCSNLLTKILERGRMMSYLEQSTRYIPYDKRDENGHYRYVRPKQILQSPEGAFYVSRMDALFEAYREIYASALNYLSRRFTSGQKLEDMALRRALRAAALDAARAVLPAGTTSNVGLYGSGQAFEYLLIRLRAEALAEAREYGELIKAELKKVIPSFLKRVDRPDRGILWTDYLAQTRAAVREELGGRGKSSSSGARDTEVRLVEWDLNAENKLLAWAVVENSDLDYLEALGTVESMRPEMRSRLFRAYVGNRQNRRHKPGRAFEVPYYTFEVVSDYGVFRDLQRHRVLTISWQDFGPHLGYVVPELVVACGEERRFVSALQASTELYDRLHRIDPALAAYGLPMAFRIRYLIRLNAREAMHIIELRSDPQGHPHYRAIVLQMLEQIRSKAGHRLIADAMRFAVGGEVDLPRLEAERRAHRKKAALEGM